MIFRAREFQFNFPRPALVMGVVNVTPDSFSDGGKFADPKLAGAHALELIEEGADILDIGGESTRPRATPVSADEELHRVIPVIKEIAAQISIPISIDTMKPEVARAALEAGASIVNDVAANTRQTASPKTAGQGDEMWRLVAETGAGYIGMHMQGTPETMQEDPFYADVVEEVHTFFGERLSQLTSCGVNPEQIAFDVGIGFGKKLEHNLQLLSHLRHFKGWNRPVVLGVSRKSFIGKMFGATVTERLPGSLACACWAVQNGVQMIRTHDVAATKQAIGMTQELVTQSKGHTPVSV